MWGVLRRASRPNVGKRDMKSPLSTRQDAVRCNFYKPRCCAAATEGLITMGTFDMRTRYSTPGIPEPSLVAAPKPFASEPVAATAATQPSLPPTGGRHGGNCPTLPFPPLRPPRSLAPALPPSHPARHFHTP